MTGSNLLHTQRHGLSQFGQVTGSGPAIGRISTMIAIDVELNLLWFQGLCCMTCFHLRTPYFFSQKVGVHPSILPSTKSSIDRLHSESKASAILRSIVSRSSINLVRTTNRHSKPISTLVLQMNTTVFQVESSIADILAVANTAVRNSVAETAICSDVDALTTGNFDAEGECVVAVSEVGVFAFGAGSDGGVGAVGGGFLVEPEGVAVCVDGGEVDGRAGVDG